MSSRFYAKIVQVYPPKSDNGVAEPSPPNQASSSTSPQIPPLAAEDNLQIHKIGGDLKIPIKEAAVRDDPLKYFYKVQILEEQHDKSHEKGKAALKDKAKWSGSLMDVQSAAMRYVVVFTWSNHMT
jgi:hypothetical protein